jgi:hypothetical protein
VVVVGAGSGQPARTTATAQATVRAIVTVITARRLRLRRRIAAGEGGFALLAPSAASAPSRAPRSLMRSSTGMADLFCLGLGGEPSGEG